MIKVARQRYKKCTYKGINFDSIVEKDWYKEFEIRKRNLEKIIRIIKIQKLIKVRGC